MVWKLDLLGHIGGTANPWEVLSFLKLHFLMCSSLPLGDLLPCRLLVFQFYTSHNVKRRAFLFLLLNILKISLCWQVSLEVYTLLCSCSFPLSPSWFHWLSVSNHFSLVPFDIAKFCMCLQEGLRLISTQAWGQILSILAYWCQ